MGEVRRPAIYELKDKEKLSDLIDIIGGMLPTTYGKRIQIDRILKVDDRAEKNIDRTLIDINLNNLKNGDKNIPILDGDIITFFKTI